MRVIRNKTVRPMRVPLPKGKVLHLGPRKEGQISAHDLDHPPLQKLVESGEIEILDDRAASSGTPGEGGGHVDVQGHHPNNRVKKRGDR
jgi:hypothetical protein